jgi:hypothetical protein
MHLQGSVPEILYVSEPTHSRPADELISAHIALVSTATDGCVLQDAQSIRCSFARPRKNLMQGRAKQDLRLQLSFLIPTFPMHENETMTYPPSTC